LIKKLSYIKYSITRVPVG